MGARTGAGTGCRLFAFRPGWVLGRARAGKGVAVERAHPHMRASPDHPWPWGRRTPGPGHRTGGVLLWGRCETSTAFLPDGRPSTKREGHGRPAMRRGFPTAGGGGRRGPLLRGKGEGSTLCVGAPPGGRNRPDQRRQVSRLYMVLLNCGPSSVLCPHPERSVGVSGKLPRSPREDVGVRCGRCSRYGRRSFGRRRPFPKNCHDVLFPQVRSRTGGVLRP